MGTGRRADALLREALAVNPFVAMYLIGSKPLPRQLPAYIGMGDDTEAASYVAAAGALWLTIPGALEWFVAVLKVVMAAERPPSMPLRPRPRRR